jgi:DNA polymerase III beta subunit
MFPSIPDFTGETKDAERKPFVVRSEVLAEMIRKTVYAVATARVNQALTGVLLTINENKIKMVATDGRRLVKIERELEEPVDVLGTGIVPVKGLSNLLRVVSVGSSNKVEIQLRETYLLAKVECAVISCRLIEGQYPDVEKVIPKDNDKKLDLERERLLSTVKQASLLTSEEYNVVRFQFEPGKLILSSGAADLGEARIELKAPYTGQPFDIGFNPELIIDALKVITKDKVTLELKQPNTAGIIRDEQGDIFLIMPINLQQE